MFDPEPCVGLLADAWRRGLQLSELPASIRPQTLDEGYDAQDRLADVLEQDTVGWKLGFGSPAGKRRTGLVHSVAGRIYATRLHRPGDTVRLPHAGTCTVEFELAFVLARDIFPDAPASPVVDAIAETRVCFELVRARFVDRRAVGLPSYAADNAGFEALVVGDPIDLEQALVLRHSLVVSVDRVEAERAAMGDDVTDPLSALSDLIAIARERRITLRKGSIVATGSVSTPFDIAASSAEIAATWSAGAVRFSIVAGSR